MFKIVWETCNGSKEIEELSNQCSIDMSDYDCILSKISYHEYCNELNGLIERCSAGSGFNKPTAKIFNQVVDGLYKPIVAITISDGDYQVRFYKDNKEISQSIVEDRGSYELDSIRGPISVRFTNKDGCDYFAELDIKDSPYLDYRIYPPTCAPLADGFINLKPKAGYEIISADWQYHDTDSLFLGPLDSRTESELVELKLIDLSSNGKKDTISINYNFVFSACECRPIFTEVHLNKLETHLSKLNKLDKMDLRVNHGLVSAGNIFKENPELHGLTIIWEDHPELVAVSSEVSGQEEFYVPYYHERGKREIITIYSDKYKDCSYTITLNIE